MAWNYDEKDLEKETIGGNYLSKSGCYAAKIVEIEEKTTTNGYGQVVIKLDVDGKETTIYHVYEGKDGVIDFKIRVLNHLLYLNKFKNPSDITKCVGKNVGVMLKAKLSQDKKYINFDLDGVYHLETGKTAPELKNNTVAKSVEAKSKQYAEETPLVRDGQATKEPLTKEEEEDDFPFG